MWKGRKIVAVMPAGRRAYMSLSLHYIRQSKHIFDELRFWVNTSNFDDISYMEDYCEQHAGWAFMDYSAEGTGDEAWTILQRVNFIRHFFTKCVEPNTIYVRFDDDICWIAPDAIENLLNFRIDHPEFFLVYPTIINNGRCTYMHQVTGKIPHKLSSIKSPLNQRENLNLIRERPEAGEEIHEAFLTDLELGLVDEWKIPHCVLRNYEKMNVNCICWFGEEFGKFQGIVGDEETPHEEQWLTTIKPKEIKKFNAICGNSLMSHFAFHTQRQYLERQTNLLPRYEIMALSQSF